MSGEQVVALLRNSIQRYPLTWYLGSVGGVLGLCLMPLFALQVEKVLPAFQVFSLTVLLLVAASDFAIRAAELALKLILRANPLPRLTFGPSIPIAHATVLAVPAMLSDSASIAKLAADFDAHVQLHGGPNVHFALLTDFLDATSEVTPNDIILLEEVRCAIAAIAERRSAEHGSRVLLLHRRRLWNPAQSAWMGWERKRGKLEEFTRLLRHDQTTSFVEVVGSVVALGHIRYVLTLDEDCRIPHGAVQALVEVIAHPLNRPIVDPVLRRVVRGHGVLQPAMRATLESATSTRFARLWTHYNGMHPSILPAWELHQDLFGFGRYVGKGLYDVDAFLRVVAQRVPANHLLSHDLFEGCLLRAGVIHDVHVSEEFPNRYAAFVGRQHRWTRGDWQLLPWLLPATLVQNWSVRDLPPAGRWILLDTMRDSLVPVAALALLIVAPAMGPLASWAIAAAFAALALPVLLQYLKLSWSPSDAPAAPGPLRRASAAQCLVWFLVNLALLPEAARVSADAIARTLFRLTVTRRKLLEWKPARLIQLEARQLGPAKALRRLWAGPALLATGAPWVLLTRPDLVPIAWPVLGLWTLAPFLALALSLPAGPSSAAELSKLRASAE